MPIVVNLQKIIAQQQNTNTHEIFYRYCQFRPD